MRTTIDLDDELLKEALKVTGMTKKTRLLEEALREIIRRTKREKIVKKFGQLKIDAKILKHRHIR